SDRKSDITGRIMTPLLVTRKTPVTARTAGSCDWPKEPSATPVFILLFFSSFGSVPKGPGVLCRSVSHIRPTRAWSPPGGAGAPAPPTIGAYSGSQAVTRGFPARAGVSPHVVALWSTPIPPAGGRSTRRSPLGSAGG